MTPNIIVINLDRDLDRMAHMRVELERANLKYERFPALRGDQLPCGLARYFPLDASLSPGEIGCYASHLAIMQRVGCSEPASPTLVLEDDVGLPDNLAVSLSALVAALPAQWDIVRLSYPTKLLTRPIAELGEGRQLVRYTRVPTTTGAYLINAQGARKFLIERSRYAPIDHDLRDVWAWDLDTYGVSPSLIAHDVLGASTIDALSPKGRADVHARRRRSDVFARLKRGVLDFGLSRWLAAGPLNLAARITPKPLRPSFVRWANQRLA